MIVHEENGQYTDAFNEFLDAIRPKLDDIEAVTIQWLQNNGAAGIDYRTAQQAIFEEMTLSFTSRWMDYVTKQEQGSEVANDE